MATKFLSAEAQYRAGVNIIEKPAADAAPTAVARTETVTRTEVVTTQSESTTTKSSEFAAMRNQEDAPPCSMCGSIMIRSGSCYKCANCGTTSGCA